MIYITFKNGQVIRIAEVASAIEVEHGDGHRGRLKLVGKAAGDVQPGQELGSYFTEYIMGWYISETEDGMGLEVLDDE